MSDRLANISFDEHTCPSLDQMIQYKDGALGEQESHAVERHLLSCSLCSEVIGHLHHDNIGEITALTGAIDLRVDERIFQGGTALILRQCGRSLLINFNVLSACSSSGNLSTSPSPFASM